MENLGRIYFPSIKDLLNRMANEELLDQSSNVNKNTQINSHQNSNIIKTEVKKRKSYRKGKIDLSLSAQDFKSEYFLIFTDKKKFPKTIIWRIHEIIQKPLKLKPITRDIIRFNDKYFEKFLKNSEEIIKYLVFHKAEILYLIPELSKY